MRTMLEKFDKQVAKYDRLDQIAKQINAMIDDVVPHIYTDGDVRMIGSGTYGTIRNLMDERNKLLGLTRQHCTELIYLGPLGKLTIKESK